MGAGITRRIDHQPVGAARKQRIMKGFVHKAHARKPRGTAALPCHLVQYGLDLGQSGVIPLAHGLHNAGPFKRSPEAIAVFNFLSRKMPYMLGLLWQPSNKPLLQKGLQCFAHRAATDTKMLGNFCFADGIAGRKPSVKQTLLDVVYGLCAVSLNVAQCLLLMCLPWIVLANYDALSIEHVTVGNIYSQRLHDARFGPCSSR